MDIAIPKDRIKHFTRSLGSIARIGDELAVHVTRESFKLTTISAARSAFCLFTYYPAFFSKYRVTAQPHERGEAVSVQFRILGKTLYDIFKQKTVADANRAHLFISPADFARAEDLAGSVDENDRTGDEARERRQQHKCRLTITLFFDHGIKKTYKLTYQAGECMVAIADAEDCSSRVTVAPRTIKDWVEHFALGRHGSEEITFWFTPTGCKIKSYESASAGPALERDEVHTTSTRTGKKRTDDILSKQTISTSLNVATVDFDDYQVNAVVQEDDEERTETGRPNDGAEALITVTLKEFKAMIEHAMAINSPVVLHFTRGGEPLIAALEADDCEIQFVQSTNAEDHGGILHEKQAQAARSGAQQQDVKPRLSQARLPSTSQQQQQRGASRAGSLGAGMHSVAHGTGSVRNASVAGRPQSTPMPGPRSKASTPLFAPKEEEEDAVYNDKSANMSRVSRTSYGSGSKRDLHGVGTNAQPITLDDDDDDEEALWGDEEPSFSQAVATMDLDTSLQSKAKAKVGGNGNSRPAGPDVNGKPGNSRSGSRGRMPSTTVQGREPQEEEMGMSLDDTEMDLTYEDLEEDEDFLLLSRPGDARSDREEAGVSENSKKKKSWQLGLTN